MNNPFTPPPGGFGFGFGPGDRRALHEQRRQARREFREHLRDHLREHGPFGPGFQAGRGFGPGRGFDFGFDPRGGFGFGFGPGPRGRGRGGRGRGKRGDVRAAILTLLAERPMHGYEMIQEIAERSQRPVAAQPRLGLPDAAAAGRRGPHRRHRKRRQQEAFRADRRRPRRRREGRDPAVGGDRRGCRARTCEPAQPRWAS